MIERFKLLLQEMNRGIYEKETEISLSLLAALAGESIILLGPPGVAKSMVARQLKTAFRDAQSFEYLMSRFSTPDEIFGPVSIQKLKTSDTYERAVEGYLPTADVVFLDEIWKAGPAIQNTLLTVINEKIFRNGNREMHLPLKLLVAASNELPAKGEGLEALWDRFVIRIESRPIKLEKNFRAMLLEAPTDFLGPTDFTDSTDSSGSMGKSDSADFSDLKITAEEYAEWAEKICKIGVKEEVLDAISAIRKSLRTVNVDEAAERRNIYVSDRRWKNIVRLLRTSAFMQDREEVDICDLLPIYHCLWQEPEERDAIRNIVIRALFSPFADKLVEMKNALAEDIKYHRVRRNPEDG
ncbi:AAA family ATPase, partial [Segatella sp.]|uniref:AAA family ATPase n=1 Tax=Segatella sp. TaxID=2974253 RepID=UPI0030783301